MLHLQNLFLDELPCQIRGLAGLVQSLIDKTLCDLIGYVACIFRLLIDKGDRQQACIGDQIDRQVVQDSLDGDCLALLGRFLLNGRRLRKSERPVDNVAQRKARRRKQEVRLFAKP
ncbi:hypothetical protein [Mesorhizobium sp. LNHC252B00]|uniref:hypothetical protein n=1 Tax=Mesorhizobium sp. LNHC252B00 TaxID=1287252 RepID=UPI001FD928F1|nr:hypothetical protein [Mesorhizobium sp. LNHC252B00]